MGIGGKIQIYLSIVPLPILVAVALGAISLFLLIPLRHRLTVALTVAPLWLAMNRFSEWGVIAAISKVTTVLSFTLIALAAFMHPGPRRRIAAINWVYPVMAIVSFSYIFNVVDFSFAVVDRVMWLTVTMAALLVARTIVDDAALQRVVGAITVGLILAICIPFFDLLINPIKALAMGRGRFTPLGGGSNQVGLYFTMATPLTLYAAIRARHRFLKPFLYFFASLSFGMGLITASRSTIATMSISLLPLLFHLTRRPLLTLVGSVLFIAGLLVILNLAQGAARFERLASLETGRYAGWGIYLRDIIARRPLFGLMFSQGESIHGAMELGRKQPHNAYIKLLYLGGLSFFLPLFSMAVYSGLCGAAVWFKRHRLNNDPLLIGTLVAMLAAMYAHGFVNTAIYGSRHLWGFFHVTLACVFVTAAVDLRKQTPSARWARAAPQLSHQY